MAAGLLGLLAAIAVVAARVREQQRIGPAPEAHGRQVVALVGTHLQRVLRAGHQHFAGFVGLQKAAFVLHLLARRSVVMHIPSSPAHPGQRRATLPVQHQQTRRIGLRILPPEGTQLAGPHEGVAGHGTRPFLGLIIGLITDQH